MPTETKGLKPLGLAEVVAPVKVADEEEHRVFRLGWRQEEAEAGKTIRNAGTQSGGYDWGPLNQLCSSKVCKGLPREHSRQSLAVPCGVQRAFPRLTPDDTCANMTASSHPPLSGKNNPADPRRRVRRLRGQVFQL